MRAPIVPADVVAAAEHVHAVLGDSADSRAADWSVAAGSLEWTVRATVVHAASATVFYAMHLAGRSTAWVPATLARRDDATDAQQLRLLPAAAHVLAAVASGLPATTRAYHPHGMADVEGFVAMGCNEILVHGHDAAAGLRITFDPPADVCRRVVARLFPWAPDDLAAEAPWPALLWANGRRSLAGQPDAPAGWAYQCAPLPEWDGTVATSSPPESYTWDEASQTWRPVP